MDYQDFKYHIKINIIKLKNFMQIKMKEKNGY